MRTRPLIIIFLLGLLGLSSSGNPAVPSQAAAQNLPEVFSSPINASCQLINPYECRLHVDPFTIHIVDNQRLVAFQLQANGRAIYDFRTDVSNPPATDYTPSSVKLGFAAACGETFTVNLLARDTGDNNFLNAGRAENITCPDAAPTPTAIPNPPPIPTTSAKPPVQIFLPFTRGE